MYRVLIVDDETIMRLSLSSAIDWQENGYELCHCCGNGKEALQYMQSHPIDIVLTDLVMPVMDGLELIDQLKNQSFPGIMIVLSNHSDFNLVRQALTAGALDYILKKDLSGSHLLSCLKNAADVLEQTAKKREIASAKEKLTDYFRGRVLSSYLLEGAEIPLEQLQQADGFYNRHQLVYFVVAAKTGEDGIKETVVSHVANTVRSVFAGYGETEIFAHGNEMVLLLYGQPDCVPPDYQLLCEKLARDIALYFNLAISAIIPDGSATVEDTAHKIKECQQAAQCLFYDYKLFISPKEDIPGPLPAAKAEALAEALLRFGPVDYPDSIPSELANFLASAIKQKTAPELLLQFLQEILAECERTINQNGQYRKHWPLHGKTLPRALEQFTCMYNELRSQQDAGANIESARIIQYLSNHMHENITLDDLATHLSLNRSYLSRLFKQQTGKNIFTCLNEMRMERAAELLRGGGMYVKEVAQRVGFTDSLYFTKAFAKYHGASPKSYAAKHKP